MAYLCVEERELVWVKHENEARSFHQNQVKFGRQRNKMAANLDLFRIHLQRQPNANTNSQFSLYNHTTEKAPVLIRSPQLRWLTTVLSNNKFLYARVLRKKLRARKYQTGLCKQFVTGRVPSLVRSARAHQ